MCIMNLEKDNRKYFIVNNKALANGIAFATNEHYYNLTNKEGKTIYSFLRTDDVIETYNFLMSKKRKTAK